MDQAVLVSEDKRAGLALVKALEQAGIPVTSAFWYELPDTGRWRLFIVSPWVDSHGLMAVYEKINGVIWSLPPIISIKPDDVTAIREDNSVFRHLTATFAARPGGVNIDLPAEEWGGVDFGDTYIYRLTIPPQTTHSVRRR
jgi:hypothetical protein